MGCEADKQGFDTYHPVLTLLANGSEPQFPHESDGVLLLTDSGSGCEVWCSQPMFCVEFPLSDVNKRTVACALLTVRTLQTRAQAKPCQPRQV